MKTPLFAALSVVLLLGLTYAGLEFAGLKVVPNVNGRVVEAFASGNGKVVRLRNLGVAYAGFPRVEGDLIIRDRAGSCGSTYITVELVQIYSGPVGYDCSDLIAA